MSECNKHLWHMPNAPENLSISCMTCGKKATAVYVNMLEDHIEKLRNQINKFRKAK